MGLNLGAIAGAALNPTALLGTGLAAGETWYNNRMSEKMMHEKMDFDREMYGSRYQMQVKDMKAAGLNPMLAYQHSAGSAPSAAAAPIHRSNVSEVFNQSRIASAQEANLTANSQKAYAEVRNLDADTLIKAGMPALVAAQVVQANSSASQASAMVDKIGAEIKSIEQNIEKMKVEIQKDKSNIKLNDAMITAQNYLNGLRVAETYLTNSKSRTENLHGDTIEPKAKAAKTTTAELGATADNIGKIGEAAWKFMFPTLTGGAK